MWRLRPDVVLAALWAAVTTMRVRRQLRQVGTNVARPWAPRLGPGADRGVWGYLTRLTPNCLERAVVAQAWLARSGDVAPDVIVGVPRSGVIGTGGATAHAWLDGRDPEAAAGYVELHRLGVTRTNDTGHSRRHHTD